MTLQDIHKMHNVSYMSVHVLLNLLNELEEKDKMLGCAELLVVFPNGFNKISNTGVRIQDSKYHSNRILFAIFIPKRQDFAIRNCDVLMDVITSNLSHDMTKPTK